MKTISILKFFDSPNPSSSFTLTLSLSFCRYFPDNVDIITQLGIIFLKLNDNDLAYEKLHNLQETDNATTESMLALGAILQIKCDAEGALNIYKNIPNIQSEGFEVWNNIGMCFYRKNKLIAVSGTVVEYCRYSIHSSRC